MQLLIEALDQTGPAEHARERVPVDEFVQTFSLRVESEEQVEQNEYGTGDGEARDHHGHRTGRPPPALRCDVERPAALARFEGVALGLGEGVFALGARELDALEAVRERRRRRVEAVVVAKRLQRGERVVVDGRHLDDDA